MLLRHTPSSYDDRRLIWRRRLVSLHACRTLPSGAGAERSRQTTPDAGAPTHRGCCIRCGQSPRSAGQVPATASVR
jgi:hypothetical protein